MARNSGDVNAAKLFEVTKKETPIKQSKKKKNVKQPA